MRIFLTDELAEFIKPDLGDVGTVWANAEAQYRANPGPYLGGVTTAFRWVFGYGAGSERAPILGEPLRASPAAITTEDMEAAQLVAGRGAINPRYAAGVAQTLGWLRGILPANPLHIGRRNVA